jgi:flagellar hook protein FlgE
MYAAIAGLKSHMNKLNVISNNISNINTNGYKTQRTVFRDSLYTTYSSGSDGTGTVGSKNPSQIGYGSTVASIDLDMTPGTYAPGNALDCTLYGDGFFLVGNKDIADVIDPEDPTSFKSLTLARVGDFRFGADGYLTDGNGETVYGFMCTGVDTNGNPIVSDQLVPIRLPRLEKVLVNSTTGEEAVPQSTAYDATTGNVLPDYEEQYVVRYAVDTETTTDAATGDTTVSTVKLEDYWPLTTDGTAKVAADENPLAFAQLDSISIDSESGRIYGTVKDTDQQITVGYLAVGNVTNPNGVTHIGDSYYKAEAGAGDLSISMLGGVASDLGITHVNGKLAQANIDRQNANIADPADQVVLNLSRKAEIGSAGTTQLITGGLEGSNVDLATEISEMITTQRGYQANTRIITVTDSMLEELVNMKR